MALNQAYGNINTDDFAKTGDLKPSVLGGIEGIHFEEAQSLQPAGASTMHSDFAEEVTSAMVLHEFDQERAADRSIDVDGVLIDINIFPDQADLLTNPSFTFVPTGDSRLFDIQLISGGIQTNVMFDITDLMTGKKVWSSKRIAMPSSGNTFRMNFADASIGNVPFDLMDGETYTFTFFSEDGDVLLMGITATQRPWMTVSFYPFFPEEIAYKSEVSPVVKTSVQGVNFGDSQYLQIGGESLFLGDRDHDHVEAFLIHLHNEERAKDRFIDVAAIDTSTVFPTQDQTVVNPSYTWEVDTAQRMISAEFVSAAAQTNVNFRIKTFPAGVELFVARVASIPGFGTPFTIDFASVSDGNVPADLVITEDMTLSFDSPDGDVSLRGNGIGKARTTFTRYPIIDETIAYLSDLTSAEGTFHIDLTTTVPVANRDGSIFRPYISVTEALADIGAATVSAQHTLIVASGDYSESFTLPIFTHIANPGFDAESVKFTDVTFDQVGGRSSMERCQVETFTYDTTGVGGGLLASLTLINVILKSSSMFTGRGAGSDMVIISADRFDQNNSIAATDIDLIIHDSLSTGFTNNLVIIGTSAGSNLLNGFECNVDIQGLTIPNAGSLTMTASTGKILFTAKNSVLPTAVITGDDVNIHRDANTVFGFVGPGTPIVVNLDKAIQVEYDNTTSLLTAEDAQAAIDEINTIAQLYGSSLVSGSADINAIDMIRTGDNLYDTTTATFVFIDRSDPLNHVRVVKEYPGEIGRTLSLIEIQRNVFIYMDVGNTPPTIFESLQAPELELNEINNLVSIGNFDLIETTVPFDTIQVGGVNTFVHTSYAQSQLTKMLSLTRGNFNIFGSVFSPGGTDLTLSISPGRGLRLGVNVQADFQNPDVIEDAIGFINNVNMQWVDNGGATNTQFQGFQGPIDNSQFFDPSTNQLEDMNANDWQIMYLYKFYGSNSIRAHFGDFQFNTQIVAEAAVRTTGPAIPSDQTLEAQLRGALVVKGNATDLSQSDQATFIPFA